MAKARLYGKNTPVPVKNSSAFGDLPVPLDTSGTGRREHEIGKPRQKKRQYSEYAPDKDAVSFPLAFIPPCIRRLLGHHILAGKDAAAFRALSPFRF
jgi:hypothetical protein